MIFPALVQTIIAQDPLQYDLEKCYRSWRESILRKDTAAWQMLTAPHRQAEIRNRIHSEKRSFPSDVFKLPAPPPSLQELRFLSAMQNGRTAKSSYFGKVDFGVGGQPTENLLILSFVRGGSGWTYDRADFVNLVALPDVRKELAAGNLKYLQEVPEAKPNGKVPIAPMPVPTAKYIAKVYAFCPGRSVDVQINKISRHHFANAQEAEIVIGGAVDGINEVQFRTKILEGASGIEAFTVRVYLMSEIQGVKPFKAYEYLVREGDPVKPFVSERFEIGTEEIARLLGRDFVEK